MSHVVPETLTGNDLDPGLQGHPSKIDQKCRDTGKSGCKYTGSPDS